MGVHVPEIERAAVGRVVVDGGEGRRGAQQVVFHNTDHPRDVPAGGRIAQLRLGAPAVGGGDAERQATVESRDPKSTRLNSSHSQNSDAGFCLTKISSRTL